jgi:hypothetical protein
MPHRMSLTTVPMGVLLLLQERGLLSEVDSACDFGSMEFDSRTREQNRPFEALFERQRRTIPDNFYDHETGRLYGIAKAFYEALGWSYVSFDIDGRWGSVAIDLNVDRIPDAHRKRYALTNNIGTSEHVFNQYNFFLQAHDVTRVGGLMFHVVPFNNYQNHGLYQYCPTFFLSLARYNKYEMLGLWQCGKPRLETYRPGLAKPEGSRTALVCVMRRTADDDFRFPLQVNEPMLINAGAEARYGTFERLPLEAFRGTTTLPDEFHLRTAEASVHEGPAPLDVAAPSGKPEKKAKVKVTV